MKVVIAPQEFKGSISALEAARAMEKGVKRVVPDIETVLVPVADGGDGTLQTLVETSGGNLHRVSVTGPLGSEVEALWGAMGDGRTAVIEMARTSGLALLHPDKLDCLTATTYGLGEAIKASLELGFRSLIIGIGGSATNDGGAGMAQALGVRLLDSKGHDLPFGGAALANLDHISMDTLDRRTLESEFLVACDVSNPLTGPEGASAVYGPQKGATPKMVKRLDAALVHFAKIVQRDIGIDIGNIPGGGAAGGLGAGMVAFLSATMRPGVDIVLETVGLEKKLVGADLVITGEGQMDFQTIYKKAPIGVAKMAKKRDIPVIAISGSLGERFQVVHDHGIDAAAAITTAPMTLEEASAHASELIASETEEALRFLKTGAKVFGKR